MSLSTNEERARQLAERFRAAHELGDGPIKDMFELVHAAAGVDVLSVPVAESEHGLSMIDPATGRIVVAVATTAHPMRQRSSIAHELGHILAGDLDRADRLVPEERSSEEIRADAFARHLLLPLRAIRSRFPAGYDRVVLAELSGLVQEFEVSAQLAAIQLRTGRLIDDDTCSLWSRRSAAGLATRFGWASQYRSLSADSATPRAPQALMTRAVEGYRRGVLGIGELSSWYGRAPEDLERELDASAGTGGDPDEGYDDWASDAPLFPTGEEGPGS